MWKKKEVGDLVTTHEGVPWQKGHRSVLGRVGVIVRNDTVKVDVRVHAGPRVHSPNTESVAAPRAGPIPLGFFASAKNEPIEPFQELDREERSKAWTVVTLPIGDVEIFVPEQSDFPLEQLPLSCLSLVLAQLRLRDAAELARVSQRFCRAFRDEVAWRRRCEREPDVMQHYDGSQSFYALFRDRGPWRVRIVCLEADSKRVSDAFYVLCRPTITVEQLQKLVCHKRYQAHGAVRPTTLRPFDPSALTMEKGAIPHSWLPEWPRPNCAFDASQPQADIRTAGLVPEAVLSVVRERRFLD